MTEIGQWALAVMLAVNPPGKTSLETAEQGRARYGEIAAAIDGAAHGDRLLASLLLSVSFFESGWRADVDDGRVRGDGGRSCTLWQLQLTRRECDALVLDRELAAQRAAEFIQRSLRACRQSPPELRLAAYAGGRCDRGLDASRRRWIKAEEWRRR